jgi:hypothetical protein
MKAKAEAEQRWDLLGIGQVVQAWGWLKVTDVHGELIIKEAFDQTKFTFNYDNQEFAYQETIRLLDAAIVNLSKTDGAVNQAYLSRYDRVYSGDRIKWLKFAYGLKAMALNHYSNKSSYKPQDVIAAVDLSFTSSADDALMPYSGTSADNADGNFLYVSQALQDIERDNYPFSRLDELPQGLNQWYEAWFERKFPNPKVDFVDARKVLEVILSAKEPLTTSMITFAANITDDYIFAQTMSELKQFLVGKENKVTVYHKSITDWLYQNHGYRVSAISGNRQLAAMCQTELRTLPKRIGMQLTYHNQVYCRFLLQHLAECGDWLSYRAVLSDETLISLVFPLSFERGRGTWRHFLPEKVVHPALSWVEIQSTAVEQYSRFEVFDIAIASRSSLNRHDLTVDPFSYRIGDPVCTVGHNVIDSLLQTPS